MLTWKERVSRYKNRPLLRKIKPHSGEVPDAGPSDKEPDNRLILSAKDSEIFFKAIESPPAPNQKLKDALKMYRKAMQSADDRDPV
jgi:hypothetical protein